MKTLLCRLKTCLAAAALAAMPLQAAIAAPTFAVAAPDSVAPGASFTVQVSALDITDLYAFQFDLTFDPALFAASGAAEGPFLAGAGTTLFDGGAIDNAAGVISYAFGTLIGSLPGASGSGVLISFDFDAKGLAGSAGAFQLINVIAVDSSIDTIDVAVQGSRVSIPEPAALSLSVVALALLGASARRRGGVGSLPRAA
ncbi:cohesin domain-containing protein [Plasticicumulans sp.]|uniref:cohesin domain-containing protein n=1 Tax=Plasticicumulans sp. TaxID=2307179 RepID=UPI0032207B75